MGRSHQGSRGDTLDGALGHTAHVPREPHARNDLFVTTSAHPEIDALQRWDLLVATTPHADVAQLSAWARVRRQAGCVPLFVFAETAGELVGGALVLHRRLPGLGDIGILPYGPVLRPDADRAAIVDAICRAIAGLARRGLAALFVQPPRGAEDVSRRLLELGFRPFTDEGSPAASLEFDLSRPTSDLRKDLSSEARSGVEQASAHGVHVRSAVAEDLPVVAELLGDTAAHHRFPPMPVAYLRTLHRHLEQGHHIKIFIAEHDGVPVATDVLTCCGDVITLRSTGMRRSATTPSGTAALLHWTALLWAKGNDYASFDFGAISSLRVGTAGVGRNDPASHVNGRDCSEASFGGQPFHYPEAVELYSSTAEGRDSDLAHRSKLGQRVIERARRVVRRNEGDR